MRTSSTRREAIKTALKAGAYATPVVLAATVPRAVAAVSPLPSATPTLVPTMSADLTLSLRSQATGSGTGVFVVTADNLGPTPASTVVVTITHPATLTIGPFAVTQGTFDLTTGIWSLGTLPVNVGTTPPIQQPTLTVNYAGTGTGIVTVTITSSTPDPNPANNTFSFSAT